MEDSNLPAFIGAIIGAVIVSGIIVAMGFIIIAFLLV
jgi:hypothetical protein